MDEIDRLVAEMGAGRDVAYTDLAYQERQNEGSILVLLALAVLMAYLFLFVPPLYALVRPRKRA